MKNKVFIVGFFGIILAGCSSSAPQLVEVTRIVQQTVLVTQLVEVVVTATPIPPTATLEATPTSAFSRWTVDQVAAAFTADGLEFTDPHTMTQDDYGMIPMTASTGIHFIIPSLCSDCGGRLMSYNSPAELDSVQILYEDLAKQSAMFFSWVFVKDNILLQINGDLPEAQAMEYQAALENLK